MAAAATLCFFSIGQLRQGLLSVERFLPFVKEIFSCIISTFTEQLPATLKGYEVVDFSSVNSSGNYFSEVGQIQAIVNLKSSHLNVFVHIESFLN